MKQRSSLLHGFLATMLLIAWYVSPSWGAAVVTTWKRGAVDTWLTNSTDVTNNSLILSSAITITNTGYTFAECQIFVNSFSGTVTANTAISVWLLTEVDGTNYDDGGTSVTPARLPDIVFPLRAVSTAQRVGVKNVQVPAGLFKALVKNDGTGVTMQGSTGGVPWTLKCVPQTTQSQ
jgi:predicted phage gp36 major capsid-like protein